MSVKSFVESVVSQIVVSGQNFSFKHGERDFQNIFADEETFPVVYLDEPIQNDFDIVSSGAIQEYYPIQLMILYKTELDFTPDQHDVLIQKARLCARHFLSLANDSDQIRSIDGIKGVEVINVFDANTSGIILSCRLSFYDSTSICADYEPTEGYVNLTNSDESWSVQIENNTSYIVPNTVFQVLDQNGWNYGEYSVPSINGGTITITALPCDLAIVTVNGNEFGTVESGGTIDVPVVNGGSNPVGTIDGGQVVIGNSGVQINGTTVGDIVAEDSLSIAVKLDGVPSGAWNATDQVWEVESAPCADATITLDSEPFLTLPSGSTTNITLQDEDGNPIDPVGSVGSAIIVPNSNDGDLWKRPSDWLPIDIVASGSNKFSGLFAVYENRVNACTMQIFTGSHTINWGDGTTQTATSGVLYTKIYNYATLASPILVDEWGFNYKMAVVNVGLVGSTGMYIDRNFTGGQLRRTLGWLDVALDCSTMTELFVSTNISDGRAHILQRLLIYDLANNMNSLQLANCINLRIFKFPFNKLATSATVNFTNSFFRTTDENNLPLSINTPFAGLNLNGTRIIKLGNLTLPNVVTSLQNFMLNALNINAIGDINIPIAQTLQNFQFGNYSLVKQGVINTSTALTNINNAWYECRNLKGIVLTQCSNITVVGDAFFGTGSLERLILPNVRVGFSIAQSALSATALNDLFTSFGTASGSQTITITGNPGASTCDPSIATAKGFTVVI